MSRTTLLLVLALCIGESFGQERNIERDRKPERVPQKWALLIGVNQYAAQSTLRFAERDIEQLERLLLASGFDPDHVLTFTNSAREVARHPFRNLIEKQLDQLLGRLDDKGNLVKPGLVQEGDVVVVALSGHGVHLADQGSFFCPSDADLDYPDTLVSLDRVYDRLLKSKAALKLIMVDACRNDPRRSDKAAGDQPAESARQFARSLANCPQGIVMMTSCKAGQLSREDEDLGHGVFLKHVLEGLEGAADQPEQNQLGIGDQNGRVSLEEAFQFARQKTQAYVSKKWNAAQEPELIVGETREALQFEFGAYSSQLPFTSFFTVRVENAQGPPARGAEIAVRYRADDRSPSVMLGRASADDEGKAELTLKLSKQYRTSGFFTGTVYYDRAERSFDLPGFLEQREWKLYAPRNSPLAEQIRELLAAGKKTEALQLAWTEWERADSQSKQLVAPHAVEASDWWMATALAEVEQETDARRKAACYGTLCAEQLRRGNRREADELLAKAISTLDKVADPIAATLVALDLLRTVASTGDKALAAKAAREASLLAEGIPMDQQDLSNRSLRMRVNIEIAAELYRLRDPDSNHYLEVAYELIARDSHNFYNDLAAYGRIMALSRAGDLKQLKSMEHLKDGEVKLGQLSGMRKFIPLGAPQGQKVTLDHRDHLTSWSLQLYCEIALAAARFEDRELYRVYSRAADTRLTAAGPRQISKRTIAGCLATLIQAAAWNGDTDVALKRLQVNEAELSDDQRDRVRLTIAECLASRGDFTAAWEQLALLSDEAVASPTFHRVVRACWSALARDVVPTIEQVRALASPANRAAVYAAFAPPRVVRPFQVRNSSRTDRLHIRVAGEASIIEPLATVTVRNGHVEYYDGVAWKRIDDSRTGTITLSVTSQAGQSRWVTQP